MKKVAVLMGSDSDLPIVQKAVDTLASFSVPYEVHVFSAHRTPEEAAALSRTAREKGLGAIIAAAGMAAHLAGAIAANTTLPVIGVPVQSHALSGWDSLLSIVQMPGGIPVATTAIGKSGATNAGLLAISMLSMTDERLANELQEYRDDLKQKVDESNAKLV